jgi:hypothetical protein
MAGSCCHRPHRHQRELRVFVAVTPPPDRFAAEHRWPRRANAMRPQREGAEAQRRQNQLNRSAAIPHGCPDLYRDHFRRSGTSRFQADPMRPANDGAPRQPHVLADDPRTMPLGPQRAQLGVTPGPGRFGDRCHSPSLAAEPHIHTTQAQPTTQATTRTGRVSRNCRHPVTAPPPGLSTHRQCWTK